MNSALKKQRFGFNVLTRVVVPMILMASFAVSSHSVFAQSALERGTVQPMGHWVVLAQASFTGKPLLVHLRTGYERAVIMPEPVTPHKSNPRLTNTEVVVEKGVVGFYPEESFSPISIKFIGQQSGSVYELVVNSSTTGTRQPLKINR